MKTKLESEIGTSATGETEVPFIPLTMDGVKERLSAFKGNTTAITSLAGNRLLVDSAIRTARLDAREARVDHEIRKLEYGVATPDTPQRLQELNAELESIKALRKLDAIFDSVEGADDLMRRIARTAKTNEQHMEEMKAEAASLESKISDIRSRDVRPELEKIPYLEDELRWVQQIMNDGKWKRTSFDFRDPQLAMELDALTVQGKYHGENTFAGVEARITEIEQQLEHLEKLQELSLSPEELSNLNDLECQLFEINSRILEETPNFETISKCVRGAENTFAQFLEVAHITALSVVEVYQITSEPITIP